MPRRQVDLAQILLHVGLHREGDFVQDVGGLVHPTPLMPRAGKDLVERLPEAERTVADGDFRGDREPTAFHCMLVLIGATPEGKKELIGFQVGVRESAQSWRELLVEVRGEDRFAIFNCHAVERNRSPQRSSQRQKLAHLVVADPQLAARLQVQLGSLADHIESIEEGRLPGRKGDDATTHAFHESYFGPRCLANS